MSQRAKRGGRSGFGVRNEAYIGLDIDCNSTEVACESFTGEILRPTDGAVAKSSLFTGADPGLTVGGCWSG